MSDDDIEYEVPPGLEPPPGYEFIEVGGHKNFIIKIDATAGELLDSIPSPTVVDAIDSGLVDSAPETKVIQVVENHERYLQGTIRIVKRHKAKVRVVRGKWPQPPPPPDILWTKIARALMSPSRYRSVWEPHLADMRHEHAECMERGDLRGARMAVVRAHVYSVPSWIWGVAGQVVAGVVRWLSKA